MRRVSTRRGVCAGLAALAAAGLGDARATTFCRDEDGAAASRPPVGPPLGHLNPRIDWGVAVTAPALYDEPLLGPLTAERPNFVAVASGLKFGNLFPASPVPPRGGALATARWSECDDVLTLAGRLGAAVRGDCLAWNDALPDWLTALARDKPTGWRDTLARLFDHHVESVFAHLGEGAKPAMRWCGLVNEPFQPWSASGGVPAWRPGPWLDALGTARDGVPTYIHRAFALGERHRSAGTALYLNEAFCESDRFGPLLRPAMLRLVDALQAAGRRVDAVGLEAHLMPQWMANGRDPDWTPFVAFLRELARRGVAIYLTELDVNDCSLRDRTARDALVARYTGSFVRAALDVPAVAMVTNWDLSDGFSWLAEATTPASTFPNLGRWASCMADPACPRPDLYDAAMRPKEARHAFARALAEAAR